MTNGSLFNIGNFAHVIQARDGHVMDTPMVTSRWPTLIYVKVLRSEEPNTDKPLHDCTKQVSPHAI